MLRMALREASPAHVDEFEPITKGFVFAVAALVPLTMIAAVVMIWRAIKHAVRVPT